MKKVLAVLLSVMLGASMVYAEVFSKKGKAGPLNVEYSSEKALTKGMNKVFIDIKNASKSIEDAKVTFQVFMPEMPGMPYMEKVTEATFANGRYETMTMFMMPGTWQVRIMIETKDGKQYRMKSSVII